VLAHRRTLLEELIGIVIEFGEPLGDLWAQRRLVCRAAHGQYSEGRSRVVTDLSASVMIQMTTSGAMV
jgi:hypothetical protein